MNRARFLLLASLASVLTMFALGCGTEPDQPKLPTLPANSTPEGAVLRFIATYEQKRDAEFIDLLTGDYVFEFSNAFDPDLVQKYSTVWRRTDEDTSARNLFHGGNTRQRGYQPGATSIDINFALTSPSNDPDSPDPARHKVLFTRIDGLITVPTTPDPTTFLIDNNLGRIFLVRGDVAVGLNPSQPGDDKHWYIYHWRDESQPPTPMALEGPLPSPVPTWARAKAAYR